MAGITLTVTTRLQFVHDRAPLLAVIGKGQSKQDLADIVALDEAADFFWAVDLGGADASPP